MNELILRNLITDKEFLISTANNDIATYGEWQCDYNDGFNIINHQINEIIKEYKDNLDQTPDSNIIYSDDFLNQVDKTLKLKSGLNLDNINDYSSTDISLLINNAILNSCVDYGYSHLKWNYTLININSEKTINLNKEILKQLLEMKFK